MERILVVDNELNMRMVLKALLTREGYEVVTASDGLEALHAVRKQDIAVVVTDLKMPGFDGMGLLTQMTRYDPSIPVIMITAYGTIHSAVDALKKGAFDYITKPFDQEELKDIVQKAIKTRDLGKNEVSLQFIDPDHYGIIGSCKPMQRIYETIRRVAPTGTTVLITGETGTGKELIANAIHQNSPQRNNPLIKINCGAIAANLMESELFGYEKGAFTGAVYRKPGKFELAHTGTLFLDEVGELTKDMQVKLLHVIQDHQFERVGGLQTIKVNVRLIAATNRNLQQDVKDGNFREDLFYRLNVFPIHLPPLRERKEDIMPLAFFFLEKMNAKLERSVRQIDEDVQDLFLRYEWPGNIRELENQIERLVLMCGGDRIRREDVHPETAAAAENAPSNGGGGMFRELMKARFEEMEKKMVDACLDECGGNVTKAAQKLGYSRKALQLKMIKYKLRKS